MEKIEQFFLSMLVVLWGAFSVSLINVFASIYTGTDSGVKYEGFRLDDGVEGCVLGPDNSSQANAYYVDVGDVAGAGIFVPAKTSGELDSLVSAAGSIANFEICKGDGSAYDGAPFSSSDSGCNIFAGYDDQWDLDCDGRVRRGLTYCTNIGSAQPCVQDYNCPDGYHNEACGVHDSSYTNTPDCGGGGYYMAGTCSWLTCNLETTNKLQTCN